MLMALYHYEAFNLGILSLENRNILGIHKALNLAHTFLSLYMITILCNFKTLGIRSNQLPFEG